MESKRKKRRAAKDHKATQDHKKSRKPTDPDRLIRYNGDLIEELFASQAWREVAFPVLMESIASVSGRFTNGRFHIGAIAKQGERDFLAGYQLALQEFHNRLHDFIRIRDERKLEKKREEEDKKAPIYNPFMEELDGEETSDNY